jgi:predicted nucleic acid binding AN1-type Zn finger protein
MSNQQQKIQDRLEQIEFAGKANGYHEKTIVRMQTEYLQAMTTNRKAVAIKAFCQQCMGYDAGLAEHIRNCTAYGCPLHNHRPYRNKGTGTAKNG